MIKRLKLWHDEQNNVFYEITENTNDLRPFVVYAKHASDPCSFWQPITKNYFYRGACLNAFKRQANFDRLTEK